MTDLIVVKFGERLLGIRSPRIINGLIIYNEQHSKGSFIRLLKTSTLEGKKEKTLVRLRGEGGGGVVLSFFSFGS